MKKDDMIHNEEICALIARERQCRIRQKPEELASCYYPDATVTTSWTNGSVNVRDYLFGGKAPVEDPEFPIISRIGYPVIHKNGRRAYAEVPQTTLRWVQVNGVKAVLACYMRLIYCVEQRVDEWRISDFRSIYESDTLAPEVPGTDLRLDRTKLAGLRHSYRYLAYVDENVSQELPGIDQPDVVKELYNGLDLWLKEDRPCEEAI